MIITQPDRVLLRQEIATRAHHLQGHVLDVGGGDGNRYRHLFKHAASFKVLDFNAELKPDIVASVEDMPLEDNQFDALLCSQMLEHVPHPWLALKEMYRVLKPGGKLLLTVPQWNELHSEPYDFYRFTHHGLKVICQEAGFKILEMHQRGRYHTVLAQTRIRRFIDLLRPYQRKWAMWLLMWPSALYVKLAIWLDRIDKSESSRRHVIGWTVLLEK